MSIGLYKLTRQTGGRGFYAEVEVKVHQVDRGPQIDVSPFVFAWLKDVDGPEAREWANCDELRTGAARGVAYALSHTTTPMDQATLGITVLKIHAAPADTCPESVALAACHATWIALGVTGSREPKIVGGQIVFES
jgi:hypothetical protein